MKFVQQCVRNEDRHPSWSRIRVTYLQMGQSQVYYAAEFTYKISQSIKVHISSVV